MRHLFFIMAAFAAVVATTGCDRTTGGNIIWDSPEISFLEDQVIAPVEGGELIIPIKSTGIDDATISSDSNWVMDENGDLIHVDAWIEVVKVISEYDADAEGTRALPLYNSAIVVKLTANDTGYSREATLVARSFTKSDQIIIRQGAAEE